MTSNVEAAGSEYSYANDGYQHLNRRDRVDTDNQRQNRRNNQPVRNESTAGADHRTCRRPRWWVWVFLVIGLVIIAGLAAVLVFVFHGGPGCPKESTSSCPKQNTSGCPKPSMPNTPNDRIPTGANCLALYTAGYKTSGVHTISPDGLKQMTVYCEQNLDNGGWTVFQRRINGQVNFDRKWSEYRNGFGDVVGEHWLGNDNIHVLTAAGNQKLKIEMTHPDGTLVYADYSTFFIENESNNYKLHVFGFTPRYPPGEAFGYHDGYAFTTRDRDNDAAPTANCARHHAGGWWFTRCHPTHLNGLYNVGIVWTGWVTFNQSIANVRMMVKTT